MQLDALVALQSVDHTTVLPVLLLLLLQTESCA
jgi:hypothetical protein